MRLELNRFARGLMNRMRMSRLRWTRIFLWLSVTAWGIGLGAKLFDLLVLASAWGALPPASLRFYPYGRNWPIDPGDFFQPLSGFILTASVGALVSGLKTGSSYRLWLWIPVIAFLLIWIVTPTVFWPLIVDLYRVANTKIVRNDAEVSTLVRHWFVFDWLRLAVIAIGFFSSVRAISIPYPVSLSEPPKVDRA